MDIKGILADSRIERKKRETRQKIVQVAMNLFSSQGFNNTTMEQIADETDIARKTLYNYFSVKEAIVDEYVRGISRELAEEALEAVKNLPDIRSRLLLALDHAYGWVESNPEIAGICINYRLRNMLVSSETENNETGTKSILTHIITRSQQLGEIRTDIPVKLMVEHMDLLRSTMTFQWLKDPAEFDLHEEIVRRVDLFLYGAVRQSNNHEKLD